MKKEKADSDRVVNRAMVTPDGRSVVYMGKRFSLGEAKIKTSSKNPKRLRLQLLQME